MIRITLCKSCKMVLLTGLLKIYLFYTSILLGSVNIELQFFKSGSEQGGLAEHFALPKSYVYLSTDTFLIFKDFCSCR